MLPHSTNYLSELLFCIHQPLQVLNDQGIDTPFVVQLCDEWGNLCSDQRVVVELKSSPQSLKVSITSKYQHVIFALLHFNFPAMARNF